MKTMKTMKRLLMAISLMLIVVMGYSQATPSGEFRIATATTDFGVNLPVGSKVFCIETNKYYVVITAVLSTEDLTDATAKFVAISDLELVNKTGTTYDLESSTGNTTTLDAATTTEAGLMTAAQFNALASVGVYTVETIEADSDDVTNQYVTLTTAPKATTSLTVSLNGYELKLTDQYTVVHATGVITLISPIYLYDQITVSYITTP